MTATATILIVDDDVSLRSAFGRALERAGYHVVTTTGTNAVVDLIDSTGAGAVLLDNHMPGVGGIELIGLIRNRWTADEVPIVLISGSSEQAEIDRAVRAGANDVQRKPVELPALVAAVRAVLDSESQK